MALTERIRRKLSELLTPYFLGREQEALVELAGASLDEAQDMVDEGIQGVQAQIDDLHSEYGAGLIGIEDQDNHFTSTNVEGALEELAERDISEENVDVTGNWSFHSPITFVDGPYGSSLGASLTDDRAYTLPDASGTIALLGDIPPQVNLIAGSNINIGGTYPNLTISSAGSGPGEGVASVNGQVGDVVLTYSDVGAAPASHTHTIAQVTGLQGALDGKANTSHTHDAADITSGIMARARLGTGTADSDTYLRGDGTWATPDTGTGGGGGTVTRVQVAGSGPGLSFTGGPITTTGTITGTLSSNLQGWSGVSPSTKWDTASAVAAGATSSGSRTFSGDLAEITIGHQSGFVRWTGSGTINGPGHAAAAVHASYSGSNGMILAASHGSRTLSFGTYGNNTDITWDEVWHSGNFNPSSQPASNISSGTFAAARIPNLSSSYVATSGNQTGIAGNKTFTGNITAANVTATSDVRLKEKVEESRGRQELLEALRHYRWKWKNSGNPGIGVLAQEVKKHAPEYVHEDDEGTLSVDKAGLALEMMFAMIDKLEAIDGSSD